MKPNTLNCAGLGLLSAALLAFTSCSSTSSTSNVETTSVTSTQPGVPGGVTVETHKLTARVTAIDTANRKVTLALPDGKKRMVKCGPDVINFDQINVGDQVNITVVDELVAYLAAVGAPPAEGAAAAVVLAPKGAKPGGVVADTVQVTATVTAIDLKHHKATLQFTDGTTRTIAVRKDVDLTQRKVGEQVVIRSTEALAISVEKP
jgi:hypothetical protein